MTANAATVLKQSLRDKPLTAIIGAHNALSARLAEQAGFDGIWASGFELSAAYGVPDASLVAMTQHLEAARSMAEAVSVPIVADIDTGFGNAVNVIHAIERYEAAGMAAVVIEDKMFPKDTSLLAGGRQELVRIEEFEGKIQAALAARRNSDFLIVARVEALIAGAGQAEAKQRAERYEAAGADAILIHSKSKNPAEIVEFVTKSDLKVPIVLVPTAYPELTEDAIMALGKVKLVIYGNHGIRAAVTGMQEAFRQIRADRGIHNVDKQIVTVERIFELQNVALMKKREKSFLR
jgi:phosphonopyruvate hydrolase